MGWRGRSQTHGAAGAAARVEDGGDGCRFRVGAGAVAGEDAEVAGVGQRRCAGRRSGLGRRWRARRASGRLPSDSVPRARSMPPPSGSQSTSIASPPEATASRPQAMARIEAPAPPLPPRNDTTRPRSDGGPSSRSVRARHQGAAFHRAARGRRPRPGRRRGPGRVASVDDQDAGAAREARVEAGGETAAGSTRTRGADVPLRAQRRDVRGAGDLAVGRGGHAEDLVEEQSGSVSSAMGWVMGSTVVGRDERHNGRRSTCGQIARVWTSRDLESPGTAGTVGAVCDAEGLGARSGPKRPQRSSRTHAETWRPDMGRPPPGGRDGGRQWFSPGGSD